jgi:hypothetical protein
MEDCLSEILKRKRISAENSSGCLSGGSIRPGRPLLCARPSIRVLNTIMPLESGLVNV